MNECFSFADKPKPNDDFHSKPAEEAEDPLLSLIEKEVLNPDQSFPATSTGEQVI